MSQIEVTSGGKWLLFLAGIAAVLAAIGRMVIQPLFAAWVFFTLRHGKSEMRAIVEQALESPLDEIRESLRGIRECQETQGRELSDVVGYVRRLGEEDK